MSEMVERVALAIWDAREKSFPTFTRHRPDEIDKGSGAWDMVVDWARAAVAEMRDPSFEMVDAFAETAVDAKAAARADNRAKGRAHPDALAEAEWVPQAWGAAIDAALGTTKDDS